MLVRSELDTDNGCSPAAGCCVQLTLRVVDKIIRKEFQRHEAAESRVLGSVGYPHTPPPRLLEDPIPLDGLADHGNAPSGSPHL